VTMKTTARVASGRSLASSHTALANPGGLLVPTGLPCRAAVTEVGTPVSSTGPAGRHAESRVPPNPYADPRCDGIRGARYEVRGCGSLSSSVTDKFRPRVDTGHPRPATLTREKKWSTMKVEMKE
jgi:hypothetical protein